MSALESQVRELTVEVRQSKQDAAAARVLAGGADRDVAEIRTEIRDFRQATTASFNAMREDITDLRREFRQEMDDRFTGIRREMDDRFTGLRQEMHDGFAEMRGKFDATAAGMEQIVRLLNTMRTNEGDG